jgi:hypothetical protein
MYMEIRMSLQARKELLDQVRVRYQSGNRKDKSKILDGFIAATGYQRKYAIGLLKKNKIRKMAKVGRQRKYGLDVYQALLTLWEAANHICSKRLVPFLPELIVTLERHGHLSLPSDVRLKLSTISPAAVDRLLKPNRQQGYYGISTTKPGSLLKHQIQVRTFADWNDVIPGFLEADLVAHCGDRVDGSYLNTLVLTDISSGWIECLPLLHKSEAQVIEALNVLPNLLPFNILGLDTDNGSEFINYKLLKFCESNKITFTRSRAYRKNDQAHVEEKNGSVIRKLIGYDRYEREQAWHALGEVYAILRLYVNFFQPSMKLLSKERHGAKIHKSYDEAQTAYQRLISSAHIQEKVKNRLKTQYENLDPVKLLQKLKEAQNKFWGFAWNGNTSMLQDEKLEKDENQPLLSFYQQKVKREYKHTPKQRKPLGARSWRTRPDPFETVWEDLEIRLALESDCTAKELLEQLIEKFPTIFSLKHLRTLQRRVAKWRSDREKGQEHFLSLANAAVNS